MLNRPFFNYAIFSAQKKDKSLLFTGSEIYYKIKNVIRTAQ